MFLPEGRFPGEVVVGDVAAATAISVVVTMVMAVFVAMLVAMLAAMFVFAVVTMADFARRMVRMTVGFVLVGFHR